MTPAAPGRDATTTIPLKPNAQVRVKVYNASGVQGTAQTMTDKLKAPGYNMQTPANLKDQRAGTVVQCVDGFKREGTLLARVRRRQRRHLAAVPEGPARGRVRRRLHRHHRHRVASGTAASWPSRPRSVRSSTSPRVAALFVDFDGSLSPIVPDPPAARALPAARAALARLVPVLGRSRW